MKKFILLILLFLSLSVNTAHAQEKTKPTWWKIQSIDTMKYSRDKAREKLADPNFDAIIEMQIRDIAQTGATHVAIGTPYDNEFLPFLKRWVDTARKYNLKIWFRGNFSGWEGWFDYPPISREEHLKLTEKFIKENNNLFKDGDIFISCPECENGGPGDPRQTNDIEGHRKFLLESKKIAVKTFLSLGKQGIETSYFSMNGDVAKLIMDKNTTQELGGIVTIDHYVKNGEQLAKDIKEYINLSGGKIVLGEFGAPIIDINGEMNEQQQHDWIQETLRQISQIDGVIGLNYWTGTGGSTQIWEPNGKPRLAIKAINSYYSPLIISGAIVNKINQPISYAELTYNENIYKSDVDGHFLIKLPSLEDSNQKSFSLNIAASDHIATIEKLNINNTTNLNFILEKEYEGIFFKIQKFFYNLFN